MFITNGWVKISEEDVWDDGCQPNTGNTHYDHTVYKNDTLEGLISDLMAEFSIESKEDVMLDSCDEKGRIDIQRMEDCNGNIASPQQISRWKRGNQKLWACTYIFNVEETKPANFDGLKGYSRD